MEQFEMHCNLILIKHSWDVTKPYKTLINESPKRTHADYLQYLKECL